MNEQEHQTENDRFVPTPKELEEDHRRKRPSLLRKQVEVSKKPRTGPIRNFIAKIRSGVLKKRTEAPAPPTPTTQKQPISSPSSTKEETVSPTETKYQPDTLTPPSQSTKTKRISRLRLPDQPSKTKATPPTVKPTPEPSIKDGPEKAEAMASKKGHNLGTWKSISGATIGSRNNYASCNKCKKRARADLVQPENYSSAHARWIYAGDALDEYCKNS